MDDFERTEYSDGYYGVLGRALVVATRFEHNARALAALVGMKADPDILASERRLQKFMDTIDKQPLAQHLKANGMAEAEFFPVLDSGRLARNHLAHEAAKGLDQNIDLAGESFISGIVDEIAEKVRSVAEADRLICLMLSLVTNEHLPSKQFLEAYPGRLVHWVVEQEEIGG